EEFDYNEKGWYGCKGGELLEKKKKDFGYLLENCKINIIGEKDDLLVHFCDKCELPIKIYGRIIPCKHAFCYACAVLYGEKGKKVCPGCSYPVLRIEEYRRGSIFMCSTVERCKRTYLSQRDLKAHIEHRHKRAGEPVPRASLERVHPRVASPSVPRDKYRMSHSLPKKHTRMPRLPPYKHYHHPHEHRRARRVRLSPPPPAYHETFRTSTRKRQNLIIVPLQDNSDSGAKEPPPPASTPAHHRPEYQSHPMPSQQRYVSPAPRSSVSHPMPYSPQAASTPHLAYNKVPLPAMTPVPLTVPPFGFMIAQWQHYMKYFPQGSPLLQNGGLYVNAFPLHYYYNPKSLPQFTGNEETLGPLFKPVSRGRPPPPLMQSSPSQTSPSGSHHTDKTKYRP
uniref:RING-type E3 ubiquitin transferase n=1 Tax=Loxodonta africana TaxID=9785 RepID=G3U347_LOXAF